MERLTFVIEGDPVPKGRPRSTRSGHTYTPQRTRDEEARIRDIVAPLVSEPFDGPVHMQLTFYCKTLRRTDLDNLEKLVCDALNGIVYTDDHWVHSKTSSLFRKAIGETPRTEVRVEVR